MNSAIAASSVLIAVIAYAVAPAQDAAKAPPTIHARDLNRLTVTGELGVPLGTVVEVEAVVVAGAAFGAKGLPDYMLRVEKVDGAALKTPPVMPFGPFLGVGEAAPGGLASSHFQLYRLKTGREARSLDQEQIAELEKDYVGRRVNVLVYESGRFVGIPQNLPERLIPAGPRFHFSTSLVVVAENKE
ncbi:MAG: hypothetical protein WD066_15810 [Planctomycetaceae bacterium]